MTKEEFIKFLVSNNFEYTESKLEININKVIDELGNVDFYLSFNKNNKTLSILEDKDVNDKDAPNHCYVLSELELKILRYFQELLK